MSKPQEILALEKDFGIILKETKNLADITDFDKSNCYFLNTAEQITGLNISDNKITKIENIDKLINLSRLFLFGNKITKIENLDTLTNLSLLDISFNQITKIENLDKLTNLSKLKIIGNQITKIENIDKLTKLYELNISQNKIIEIENIDKLTNISFLDISFNQIAKIENIDKLTNIYQLNFHNNQIMKIENIDKLIKLSFLFLFNNQITKIENLDKLTKLSSLYLFGNKITKIENLDKLISLSSLDISRNKITKIENLEKLINISLLNISGNKISKIKNIDKLTNLSKLNISGNQITKIENLKQVLNLKNLYDLSAHGNPFTENHQLVLEISANHLDIIKSELQKLKENDISIQLPVKIMLLGNHASGKSTLLKYLQTKRRYKVNPKRNVSTHVLSVVDSNKKLDSGLPKAIFYDFGGQDYYHGIYQAFFTQESVNLLVWNPQNNENKLVEKDSNQQSTRNYNRMYWLAQLEYSFLKNFNNKEYTDPLLLVQTHADIDIAKKNWQEDFQKHRIVDEFHVSLNSDDKSPKNKASLAYLTATFWDVIEQQQASDKKVPEWYPEFLTYIIDNKNIKETSLDEIIKYYKRENLSEEKKKTFLKEDLEQLARKGLLLYYKNDEKLTNVAWLNPAETVENIHKTILNKKNIEKYKGKLSEKEFSSFNIDYKIEHLLRNEKVLFYDDAKGSEQYIIPNYLPLTSENDEIFDLLKFDFNKPTFVLKFERFIPFGLINQLICYYGKNNDKKHYWRDQLIFTLDNEFKVWIQLDFSKLTIAVSIKSQEAKNSKINDCILKIFIEIMHLYWNKNLPEIQNNKDFENFQNFEDFKNVGEIKEVKKTNSFEKLKKPNDLYISVDNKYFVHYNTLNDEEKTHENIVAYELPNQKNDLDKTNTRTQRSYGYRNFTSNKNIKKMKKIFISYSREDVEYKDELRKHLNMLKLFDVADNWSCEDITIGKWHNQIQQELEESDLVIFMLSINFFNSKYILEQEVQKTMDEIANGSDKNVYSIIVSDFPGLELFNKEDMNDKQKSVLELGSYQYGMYTKTENRITGNKKEEIISLKEASNRGIIDTQLTKIVTKIMKDIS
ncbi:TIR domain-containing protein [Tenacibaculum finnmarkense]|uniref:leucine-rich repeat domain-containing protein n=1 Tax=Tenacibaculum finnmarkense TaxID=2781243 RepID=UPI001EFB0A67|nr:leucine-rich repeat domain-containing protein [Tenacibaculum finnmarkense]MCG8207164.1 leucine-rich repeat domain-containing protein [Tenacibaculum finnmarkense genomovar finnmarkense]MCG8722665.1 TIR domain-containing protein [Tenacibaculum finnmarkense]MCG8741556.1 TIR domain-containing protein [Tenacibaculum finnmarkense]MCG8764854.1 TIR domain-containing protein [Tenacibaculum finnmarkense]MCM8906218.1 leucine-rich repeat domain-containing protein [Tenacibaculum finnmarkense genomovar f